MGNVETVRTSSSRSEVGPGNRPNSIGCMSGVFHFLSRHHNRSRKRITSVKRKENPAAPPLRRLTTSLQLPEESIEDAKKMRRSSEMARIPVIPQEIRRKKPPARSPDSPRAAPALMARLMGLDDPPPPAAQVDKRRELLRALEKCDEDLQALSRIIEAIRSTEIQADTVVSTARKTTERLLEIDASCGDAKNECNGEQPSPISVLDALSSPRNLSRSKRSPEDSDESPADECSRNLKPSRTDVLYTGKSPGGVIHSHAAPEATRRRIIMEAMPSGDRAEDLGGGRPWWRARRRRNASRAMMESVEEVCGEGAGEGRWELGRVEAWVEAQLVGELVEELVAELLGWTRKLSSPTCRKRLRF